MRWGKKISNIAVLGAAIAVTGSSLYASKTVETSTLTLEQAVSRAISSCDKKEVYGSYQEAYEEVNQYNKDLFSTEYRTSVNNEKLNAYGLTHINEKLTYDATDLYLEVVRLNKKIITDQNKISVKEKELKQADIKRQKGTASDLEYKAVENELSAAKSTLLSDQKDLESAAMKFRDLTNMDITSYELEDDFEIEPAAIEGNIETYFNTELEDYWDILKDSAAIKELGKEYYIGSSLGDYKMYEATTTEAEYNYKNTKDSIILQLKTYYNSLENLKENALTYEEQLKLADVNLKKIEIQYDRGVVSQLNYEQELLKQQDIQDALFSVIKQYMLTKLIVEKPAITVMSGSNATA